MLKFVKSDNHMECTELLLDFHATQLANQYSIMKQYGFAYLLKLNQQSFRCGPFHHFPYQHVLLIRTEIYRYNIRLSF